MANHILFYYSFYVDFDFVSFCAGKIDVCIVHEPADSCLVNQFD